MPPTGSFIKDGIGKKGHTSKEEPVPNFEVWLREKSSVPHPERAEISFKQRTKVIHKNLESSQKLYGQ